MFIGLNMYLCIFICIYQYLISTDLSIYLSTYLPLYAIGGTDQHDSRPFRCASIAIHCDGERRAHVFKYTETIVLCEASHYTGYDDPMISMIIIIIIIIIMIDDDDDDGGDVMLLMMMIMMMMIVYDVDNRFIDLCTCIIHHGVVLKSRF